MVWETVEAKCEVAYPLEKEDAEKVERLGLREMSLASACVQRGRRVKKKVMRVGKWLPPPIGILKINIDGSSRGNPSPVGIGGVGRDSSGMVVLFFSIYEGV